MLRPIRDDRNTRRARISLGQGHFNEPVKRGGESEGCSLREDRSRLFCSCEQASSSRRRAGGVCLEPPAWTLTDPACARRRAVGQSRRRSQQKNESKKAVELSGEPSGTLSAPPDDEKEGPP
jgi:hypothetical protein